LDLFWPLNFSAAFVAVLGLEKNFLFAVLAEESLLSLKVLGHCEVRNPRRFRRYACLGNMLLYAVLDSKWSESEVTPAQYQCKGNRFTPVLVSEGTVLVIGVRFRSHATATEIDW